MISTQVGAKTHPDDAEPTEIWPTNAKVNAVNRQGLERLKDPPKRFEAADWVRPFKNIPPYISVDEVTHALKTCDFIKSAPASSNVHCCLSPTHGVSRRYNKLVEPTVDLKPGARILLLKNIDTRNEAKKEQPLVNGTTGRILRWATADEAEAALKAREVYLEDKLEAAREQRLAKGKRSHETSL